MKRIIFLILTLPMALPPGKLRYFQALGSQPQAPYSIHISAPQPVVTVGSEATINVVLTNTSDHPITAFKGGDSLRCAFQVHVYDDANRHCKMTESQWNQSGKKPAADDKNDYHGYRDMVALGGGILGFPLKPGLTSETSFDLFAAYILSPGKYTVWVSGGTDAVSKVVVKSNTLTITVTGATK
jgi:hypothetical protein